MNDDKPKRQRAKKVVHLDEPERLPNPSAFDEPAAAGQGRSHSLPAASSSQGAEVVKQIIEQILANERRRARVEFIQLSGFFLVFLVVIMGSGIWFARQLLSQLREERFLAQQSWRAAAGQMAVAPGFPSSGKPAEPVLDRDEVARLENNIQAVASLLETNSQNSEAAIREMLAKQEGALKAMRDRLNAAQDKMTGAETVTEPPAQAAGQVGFVTAPVAEDLKLRMPIP